MMLLKISLLLSYDKLAGIIKFMYPSTIRQSSRMNQSNRTLSSPPRNNSPHLLARQRRQEESTIASNRSCNPHRAMIRWSGRFLQQMVQQMQREETYEELYKKQERPKEHLIPSRREISLVVGEVVGVQAQQLPAKKVRMLNNRNISSLLKGSKDIMQSK